MDTNVLISALIFPGGIPDQIFRAALEGKYELVMSPFILQEFARILQQKFKYSEDEAMSVTVLVRDAASLIIEPKTIPKLVASKDDDNHILACAQAANVDYLVTGDMKHIYPLGTIGNTKIVTPAEFLRELEKSKHPDS
ncbi:MULTISPECIES: putative toxin-antitoxin system toxin component, PIN family [unclassified Neomoorella]|uniref:putative toxin-antitoxin system toxin component, PIN family n=1 Tax=unclassified Neomoorella TaxID=2676739 RepID=UPI00155A9FFA|nr:MULTISPECIES: putative toxin-antitoxin system toxin component, PIN family [unclassified Moorella (in: firmicutes)]